MDEWKNLQSLDEMIEACQIPTTILNHLSTEKLIDVVLDYPLAINIFAYDTPKEGITQLASYFNGLQELVERDDAVELMSAQLVSFSEMKSVDTVKNFLLNLSLVCSPRHLKNLSISIYSVPKFTTTSLPMELVSNLFII